MVKFSEGLKDYREEMLGPDDPKGHKCGECVRCEGWTCDGKVRHHCTNISHRADITPDDDACDIYWDRKKMIAAEAKHYKEIERRREELWSIYPDKVPVKLPIVFDGCGYIPKCPVCSEMPYSTKQCHWCGQRFIQDEETAEYEKPLTAEGTCFICGKPVTMHISRYNAHKSYKCEHCGVRMME